MDGETGGAGGRWEVSSSGPLMPIAILSSVRSQIAIDARQKVGRPTECACRRAALTAHVGGGPARAAEARMPFWCGGTLSYSICAGAGRGDSPVASAT
jgi:hypothetical protein